MPTDLDAHNIPLEVEAMMRGKRRRSETVAAMAHVADLYASLPIGVELPVQQADYAMDFIPPLASIRPPWMSPIALNLPAAFQTPPRHPRGLVENNSTSPLGPQPAGDGRGALQENEYTHAQSQRIEFAMNNTQNQGLISRTVDDRTPAIRISQEEIQEGLRAMGDGEF